MRALLGGWRVEQEFARGSIAIDFGTRTLYVGGHPHRPEVLVCDLPPHGVGPDVAAWPVVRPHRRLAPFWETANGSGGTPYLYGLAWWRDKLWAVARDFYPINPLPTTVWHAADGERLEFNLPRQKFAGFVKYAVGTQPFLGGGGYESGQGTVSGPTLADPDTRRVYLTYQWPALPGRVVDPSQATLEYWDQRCPRPPDYWPERNVESWLAWAPRFLNGTLQGRWASDRVYGGGLWLPEGLCYWPWQGTGELKYRNQTYTFASDHLNRTRLYRFPYFVDGPPAWEETGLGPVLGHEIGLDGEIYLCEGNAWRSGTYRSDPAVRLYAAEAGGA